MPPLDTFWDKLKEALFAPKVDADELAERLASLKQRLPVPVFWLLGKAQSGKTSIVRALTRRGDAEIGNSFQPCTRTARLYDFPGPDNVFMRFLDTRGLGETAYDPAEDMRLFERQAHVLVVVMKALDHAQGAVLEALAKIRAGHPDWPVLVVQTCLHEGYPGPESEHLEPYPYFTEPLPPGVPADLRRSLLAQRDWFAGWKNTYFVAVDLTRPEDGYVPADYGLEALWEAVEWVFPWGLRDLVQGFTGDVYADAAHPHIVSYALLAGGLEIIPVPMLSTPLVLAAQAKMFQSVASIYRQEWDPQRFGEIAGALGTGYLLRLGGRQLAKLVPVYGQAVAAAYSAAMTYALGKMLCLYFSRVAEGGAPSDEEFGKLYEQEFEQARGFLKKYLDSLGPR